MLLQVLLFISCLVLNFQDICLIVIGLMHLHALYIFEILDTLF